MRRARLISSAPSSHAPKRRRLVQQTAAALRERVFSEKPDTQIGSLRDLARSLGVGIVTVQQAARILEHEGLLTVRRGPGGGYYGRRPDAAALERSLAAYMRIHPASYAEALDMTSLLFTELATAAAGCRDNSLCAELADLHRRLDDCRNEADAGAFESEFQDLLFRMVERPLFELLTRVTLRFAVSQQADGFGVFVKANRTLWREGRHRIIAAVLAGDAELARFEADRYNRRLVLEMLAATR